MQSGTIAAALIPLALGLAVAAILVYAAAKAARRKAVEVEAEANRILEDAHADAERKAQDVLVAAQDKALGLDEEYDARERDLEARETAAESRALELARAESAIDRARSELDSRRTAVEIAERDARTLESEAKSKRDEATATLERIAGLTAEEAKAELVAAIEDDARRSAAALARRIEERGREDAEKRALRLVVQAAQRVSMRIVNESTITYVGLPSDEMKGRIIGREGRNIRALEHATGIDLVIDDTPEAILLSSFDPIRREIARVSILRLVEDGRIHPARIEEVVERVREETASLIEDAGQQASYDLGMGDLHPKLLRRIGRMKFHNRLGFNLLQHCVEVALLAGHMASEVGGNEDVVRRAGLFHEIARVDDDATGHPALASADLVGKFGEDEAVVHAIQSLHPDVEANSLEAMLVDVANRIASNRVGARKENLEIFVERLRRLEAIASRHDGVNAAFAVRAGKELRVLVDSEALRDDDAYRLSKQIARELQQEISYPGQIRVSVIRETRSVTFAL